MQERRSGGRRPVVDVVTGTAAALAAFWYTWEAWRLPRFQMSVVVDAHVFPMAVGIALAAVALTIVLRPSDSPLVRELARSRAGLTRAAGLLALSLAYVFALESAGFVLATFAFMVAAPPLLGWKRWGSTVAVATALSVGVWYAFDRVLQVPLPQGLWPLG